MAKHKRKYEGYVWKHGRKFYACYYFKGRLHRESFYDRASAESCLMKVTQRKHAGRKIARPDLTVGELLQMALTDMRNNDCRSIGVDSRRVKNHLEPELGFLRVSNF